MAYPPACCPKELDLIEFIVVIGVTKPIKPLRVVCVGVQAVKGPEKAPAFFEFVVDEFDFNVRYRSGLPDFWQRHPQDSRAFAANE